MVYERKLSTPVHSWCLQRDILFFTLVNEEKTEMDLFALKCFDDHSPNLFKLCLPADSPIHAHLMRPVGLDLPAHKRVEMETNKDVLESLRVSMHEIGEIQV